MCKNIIDPHERLFRILLMRQSLTLIILLVISLSVFAQDKPGEAHQLDSQKHAKEKPATNTEDVVRISVTLVQVDAVVTDKKGHPVTNLTKGDFEIYEDGKRQVITNFSYVPKPSVIPEAKLAPQLQKTTPVPSPFARLRPEQVRRTIAIVVDDLSMRPGSPETVRYHLRKFVDEEMQPGDLVAIIRASGGVGALQQFTADKRQLYAAIERIRFNPGSGKGIGSFAPIRDEVLESKTHGTLKEGLIDDSEEFREQLFAVGVLGALNYVVRGLRELPGRKSVMFISEGFKIPNRGFELGIGLPRSVDRVSDSLRRLIELANRSAVVVYSVDPSGVVIPMIEALDDTFRLTMEERTELLRLRHVTVANADARNGLNYLAHETGGFVVAGTNDLSRGIRRVLDDQDGYYLIGYVPSESTFTRRAGQLAFHKTSIKLKRAGLTIRTRGGFLGVTDEEARPARPTPLQQLTAAVTSPFTSGDVHLKLTSLFGNDAKSGYFVRFLLHIDARDLAFSEEIDGWRNAELAVAAVAFGDSGVIIDQSVQNYSLSVRSYSMDRTLQSGLVYEINLPLKKPGAYQLRTAVRDARSQKIGSANQYIEVPDINKGRPFLSALAVSGRDLLGEINPSEYSSHSKSDNEARLEAGPAVRKLRPGDDLNYAFVVYNATVDKATNAPRLLMQARLFRDGKLVYDGAAAPLQLNSQTDWKRISVVGSMRLAKGAQSGEHMLQVIITDQVAKEKYRTITQWTDFEIEK
jgi:VWFA-related protein